MGAVPGVAATVVVETVVALSPFSFVVLVVVVVVPTDAEELPLELFVLALEFVVKVVVELFGAAVVVDVVVCCCCCASEATGNTLARSKPKLHARSSFISVFSPKRSPTLLPLVATAFPRMPTLALKLTHLG